MLRSLEQAGQRMREAKPKQRPALNSLALSIIGKRCGILFSFSLLYLRSLSPDGTQCAFANRLSRVAAKLSTAPWSRDESGVRNAIYRLFWGLNPMTRKIGE